MSTRTSRGFTMLELMVVVAIIGIMAAFALPSYMSQARKSRRSDAISQINSTALAEEQWRTNCPSYAAYGAAACLTGNPTFMSAPTSTYYTFTTPTASATHYTIVGTPSGDQAKDAQFGTSCNPITYDFNAGVVTKTPSACWGQ